MLGLEISGSLQKTKQKKIKTVNFYLFYYQLYILLATIYLTLYDSKYGVSWQAMQFENFKCRFAAILIGMRALIEWNLGEELRRDVKNIAYFITYYRFQLRTNADIDDAILLLFTRFSVVLFFLNKTDGYIFHLICHSSDSANEDENGRFYFFFMNYTFADPF